MKPEPSAPGLPNLRHMRLFCIARQHQSISVAAEKMFITQPAASQAVAKLESDLGVKLLVRGSKGLSVSPEGKVFAERADRALRLLSRGIQSAATSAGSEVKVRQIEGALTSAMLRALIAVATHGSYTVAARALDLAQPTVYRTAKALEQACGFELFRSAPGGIDLTGPGQLLTRAAKLAQAEIRQAKEELAALTGLGRITFVLGSLPLARSEIVPEAIRQAITEHPQLQIRVIEGRYEELLRNLREGDIDCLIGALRQPPPSEDVVQDPLFTDGLAVVVGAGHPLANRAQVTLADTLEFPWIASPLATPAGQYIYDTLKIEDRPQTPVRVVASSLAILRNLLTNGDFVTVVSSHQIKGDLAQGKLVALPIPLQNHRRDIGLTTRRNWQPTDAQDGFLTILRDAARTAANA
jgi:DNA-binding transcriptional LysR family regulator